MKSFLYTANPMRVALGGGSATGLGKAIALDSGLPILAIPTTCAGSEMTPIYGPTQGGLERIGKDARVLPRTLCVMNVATAEEQKKSSRATRGKYMSAIYRLSRCRSLCASFQIRQKPSCISLSDWWSTA